MKKLAILLVLAVCVMQASFAQVSIPQPSPLCKVEQKVCLTDFTLTYSRPSVKGRKVFGEMLAFDDIWRFGANSPTKLKFSDSVKIGGTAVAPGEYALYAIPGKTDWTILVGKDPKVQAGSFKPAEAVAKIVVKAEVLGMNVETFTLDFMDITSTSANLTMLWEKTAVKIPITVEVDKKVMASITKTMEDTSPFWAAANFYYDTDRDLSQALTWVNKVADKQPKAFWVLHLKAKILKKMKNCVEAKVVAQKSLELAKEDGDKAYVGMNEKLIADCK
jgi:hypothetical protein